MTRPIKIPKIHFQTSWIHPKSVTALPQPGVGQTHLEVPREYLFWPKFKIHVKNIYCEHFRFYWKKNFFVIFCTLCCKNCSYIGFSGEILFSAKSKQAIHKKLPKISSGFIFKHFLLKAFIDLMKNNIFLKISQKWPIFIKLSPKND